MKTARKELLSEKLYDDDRFAEQIAEFTLMDNEFMHLVLKKKECAQRVLRVVLNREDLTVDQCITEYNIFNLKGRSVRLDVYATDGKGKKYNVEIQRDNNKGIKSASPKRARMYGAYLDAEALDVKADPEELPETYVIFITEKDVLKGDLPIYTIEPVVLETKLLFESGMHIIYVNSSRQDDTPLGRLMHDFYCTDPDDMYYDDLKSEARYFKHTEKGRRIMSEKMRELAVELSIENNIKYIQHALETNKLTHEDIAMIFHLPVEIVQKIARGEEVEPEEILQYQRQENYV